MRAFRQTRAGISATIIAIAVGAAVSSRAEAKPFYRGDLTHRPRLAFDSRDGGHISRTVARIDAREEPWASSYESLRRDAERATRIDWRSSGWKSKSDPYNGLYAGEVKNAAGARAQAAVVWLASQGCNPAWRTLPKRPGEANSQGWLRAEALEAAQTIQAMYDDWPCFRGFKVINRGIVAAEALMLYCEAFDMLSALPSSLRPARRELDRARDRIADLASDFRFWLWTVDTYDNNHGLRCAAGLGVAAITLNRYDRYRWYKPGTWYHRPKGWMKRAVKELDPGRRRSDFVAQTRSGGWAEGSSYHNYTAALAWPFYFAGTRFERGRGASFLTHPTVVGATRWMAELRLPDGRRPAIDNSRLFKDFSPAMMLSRAPGAQPSLEARRLFLWDWTEAGRPGASGRRALQVLAAYDPDPALVADVQSRSGPGLNPTRVHSKAGQAALRSGWEADAATVIINAESGQARKDGSGHESVDNGAYQFFARGDLITVPPGYAGFTNVEKTNRGHHHSIVLVDGQAPKPAKKGLLGWKARGADAWLVAGERRFDTPTAKGTAVETRYEKTDIRRSFTLVGEAFLVIEDHIAANKTRELTSLVHVNAGAAKNRPITKSGTTASFQTNRGQVPVAVGATATASLSLETSQEFDAYGEGPAGHEALRFKARGKTVTILTAIATDAGAAPSVTPITVGSADACGLKVEAEGRVWLVISNPKRRALDFTAQGQPRIETNRAFVVVEVTGGGKTVSATVGAGHLR